MPYNKLSEEEKHIIEDRGTEAPYTGEYENFFLDGTFICRRCNSPLFSAKAKFEANCGWPAFDDNFPNAIKRISDPDGTRTEIECAHCRAHLGHVFTGEGFTPKDTRHCVNSLSIKFIKESDHLPEILDS
jgi:peptide-methionine (R)-S-oxide reductase